MRCQACNRLLSDFEATIKDLETGEYLDMCKRCLSGLNIPTLVRHDLDKVVYDEEDDDGLDYPELMDLGEGDLI